MKDGICPKCGSNQVHSDAEFLSRRGNGLFQITRFDTARVCTYVCVVCGFLETYIVDERALRRIDQYVPKAAETGRKRRRR